MSANLKDWIRSIVTTEPGPNRYDEPRWEPARKWFDEAQCLSKRVLEFDEAIASLLLEAEEHGWDVEAFHGLGEMIDVLGRLFVMPTLIGIANRRKLYGKPNGANLHMIVMRTIQALEGKCAARVGDLFWASQPDDVRQRWPGLIYLGIQSCRGPITAEQIRMAWQADREAERNTPASNASGGSQSDHEQPDKSG